MGSSQSTEDPVKSTQQVFTYEATFKGFDVLDDGDIRIRCNSYPPSPHISDLFLRKNNPKYADIYNTLVKNVVYEFVYKEYHRNGKYYYDYELLEVRSSPTHTLTDKIIGFLDLKQEYNSDCHQLLFAKHPGIRIFTNNVKRYSIGSTYEIEYKKYEVDRLYYIVKGTLISEDSPKATDPHDTYNFRNKDYSDDSKVKLL